MLVTKKAPDFTATAVLADGSISEDFNLYNLTFAPKTKKFSSHIS